jgi:hypothetical protein
VKRERQPPISLPAALLVLTTRAKLRDGKPASWEQVAEETRHSKRTVLGVWQWFKELAWEQAQEFVGSSEEILRLRPDYLERKIGEAQKTESPHGVPNPQYTENKRPLPVMVEGGTLKLAVTFKDDLSRINALDGAVYQLHGDPWTTDIPSVLHVSHYPELKVVLAIEHDQPGQFLLLTEQLEAVSQGFGVDFRVWERRSLTPFVRRCQEIVREIWYKAREGTGLEMSFDRGYSLPHEYGLLQNVPLFVYRFALKHCTESDPSTPDLELCPADVDRFPYLPPHYRQLTFRDEPDLLLAAGFGPVVDPSRGTTIDVMYLCQLVTTELCHLYAKDGRIREIVMQQEALQKERVPFLKALSEFLHSFTGG